MKSLQRLSIGLFLLILAGTVSAQNGGGNAGGFITTSIGSNQGFKGVPFSADVVNETTQVLADGNRIHREMQGKVFRDSEGRTRNEIENELADGNKRVNITINDPVQHTLIFLDPQTKTATVHQIKPPSAGERVANQTPPAARAPEPPTNRPAVKFEPLGTKEIEGLTAKGTRITTTIEAGRIGNDQPLVSVSESWVSQDLRENLLTTRDDPQSGQHIRRLINIRREEPDPQLFQVPADYTVKDSQ